MIEQFTPQFTPHKTLPCEYTDEDIAEEPMLFSASYSDAWILGGDITRSFLTEIPGDDWVIDSKVHMLKTGWLPCIAGWHLDCIGRSGSHNQPDIQNRAKPHEHFLMAIGDCSLPEFINSDVELVTPDTEDDTIVYNLYNRQLAGMDFPVYRLSSGDIVRFTSSDIHRGTHATGDGWRFFIRACHTDHRTTSADPIRRQVQAYILTDKAGW